MSRWQHAHVGEQERAEKNQSTGCVQGQGLHHQGADAEPRERSVRDKPGGGNTRHPHGSASTTTFPEHKTIPPISTDSTQHNRMHDSDSITPLHLITPSCNIADCHPPTHSIVISTKKHHSTITTRIDMRVWLQTQ